MDMNEFINDAALTNPNYNWDDVLPNLRASTSWSGVPGEALGGEGAKQWCIPWGFELNSLAYNKPVFDELGLSVPQNLPEMLEVAARITKEKDGMYGIGVRGSRSWATIHPGFLSGYFQLRRDRLHHGWRQLNAAMNTEGSKAFHELWVKMIQDSGPKDWATYTWYQVGTDLGAGASGMIFDADILGYFMNGGDNAEAGNLAYAAFAANPGRRSADAECLDLVARHERVLRERRKRPGTSCSGRPACRARPVWRPEDGLREPGPPVGLG